MSYGPDPGASPSNRTFVAFLVRGLSKSRYPWTEANRAQSQRDLSLRVPVNYVNNAGVVLTAACFANGRYEDAATANCISNLLATNFRRLDVDVYWDFTRSIWSLCPVQLGSSGIVPSSSVGTAITASSSVPSAALSSGNLNGKRQETTALQLSELPTPSSLGISSSSSVLTVTPTSTGTPTAPSSGVVFPTATPGNDTVLQIGPYTCSTTSSIELFANVLAGHVFDTQYDIEAETIIVTLNVHAAHSAADPTGSAQQPPPDGLPSASSLLSSVVVGNMSQLIYTPGALLSERSNIYSSTSFFSVYSSNAHGQSYVNITDVNGQFLSPDGWPSETFVEMQQSGKRLFFAFGDVDPQMDSYNFTADSDTIFPPGYLASPRAIATAVDGTISDGCFFQPDETSLAQVNSSWALAGIGNGGVSVPSTLPSVLTEVQNLTACGISPILNQTLNNLTADSNVTAYREYALSTIWSWARGQPVNASTSEALENYRCAALNSSSGYWEVADCSDAHYGACRIDYLPYSWDITRTDASYNKIGPACAMNTTFDVPRTALENTYLLSTWKEYQSTHDDDAGPLLWMDFNDLDVSACWVIGQNTSCPYLKGNNHASRRVVVPVVAAIIIFVLAILTVLVKCAGNRRSSKRRRRRGGDGWDYEGVPS